FHSRFHPRFALAVPVEESQGGGGEVEKFVRGQKVGVEVSKMRRGAQAPAQVNSETAPQCAVLDFLDGPQTDVVNTQTRMVFATTFKRDFEFSAEVLVPLVANQKAKQRRRVRRHIKGFGC